MEKARITEITGRRAQRERRAKNRVTEKDKGVKRGTSFFLFPASTGDNVASPVPRSACVPRRFFRDVYQTSYTPFLPTKKPDQGLVTRT